MASSVAVSQVLEYQAQADRNFQNLNYTAAQIEIEKLNALDFSFLDITDTINYENRRVTVCIVAYRKSDEARKLLETIQRLSLEKDYSFCLVSNSSEDLFESCPLPLATRKILVGANLGASMGRNVAIHSCESEYVIFIDDDGHTTPDCVKSLFETAKTYDATAVRGRVIPKAGFLNIPSHYDRGDFLIPHYMNIEGMTIWRLDALRICNFDPLLFGHEGIDLTARLYPLYGPNAFLYDPNAILLHDYGNPNGKGAEKLARMQENSTYLGKIRPNLERIKKTFQTYWDTELARHSLEIRRHIAALPPARDPETEATVLTTCHNGAGFIQQYAEAWRRQTDKNLRVIFVDDGSNDGSGDLAREAFKGFDRFLLIQTDHIGRGAALNLALMHAETDIVLIADVDDIPAPQRVDWTRRVYEDKPALQVVGFGIFSEQAAVREQSPYGIYPTPLRSRALLGMPMPFPAISFRKSAMVEPFDVDLKGGIDCDWLLRNLSSHPVEGCFLPTSMVYYTVHEAQISASNGIPQKEVKLAQTRAYHQSILGLEQTCEIANVAWFTGLEKLPMVEYGRLNDYASLLSKGEIERSPQTATHSVMQIYRTMRLRAGIRPTSMFPGFRVENTGIGSRTYRNIAIVAFAIYLLVLVLGVMLLTLRLE